MQAHPRERAIEISWAFWLVPEQTSKGNPSLRLKQVAKYCSAVRGTCFAIHYYGSRVVVLQRTWNSASLPTSARYQCEPLCSILN